MLSSSLLDRPNFPAINVVSYSPYTFALVFITKKVNVTGIKGHLFYVLDNRMQKFVLRYSKVIFISCKWFKLQVNNNFRNKGCLQYWYKWNNYVWRNENLHS